MADYDPDQAPEPDTPTTLPQAVPPWYDHTHPRTEAAVAPRAAEAARGARNFVQVPYTLR